MSRDLVGTGLAAVAYAAAAGSMLTFENMLDGSVAAEACAIATWAMALAGALMVNWKRGLWVLPSALVVLAQPLAFLVGFSNMALD